MQGALVRHVLPRSTAAFRHPAVPARRANSSFIKQVMEQVKRDMEADAKLKKDWDKVQQTSAKVRNVSSLQEERLSNFTENLKSMSSQTSEMMSGWKATAEEKKRKAAETYSQAREGNETIKKATDFVNSASESGNAGSRMVFTRAKDAFVGVMDSTSRAFSYFGDEASKVDKWKDWKVARDVAAAKAEAQEQAVEAAKAAAAEGADAGAFNASAEAEPAMDTNGALVVSTARTSSWDRFGTRLSDMPFLSNVFENPLFERLFGESQIAASIREMKDIDYTFHLEDFGEDVEHIVAPHIIKTYLEGDQDVLKNHCGDAAFAAVNASIKARKEQQLTLDTNILAGPQDVELKGATLMEKGPPCFIWTFNMQQVNCLRDKRGEIIEGAVDDIRTVFYAMAVQKNTDLEATTEVAYPWQVAELAILGNQPCF